MIGMVSGVCLMAGTGEAIVDCGGVGYLVQCGSKTLSQLSEGSPARLHIETIVREQSITLYGFASEESRAWFVRLQSVQGVGPKAALAILDILSPGEIMSAAALVSGGANEAQRNEGLSDMRLRNDAVSALENLGIGQSDALRAVAKAYGTFADDPSLDDLIKVSLKELGS